MALESLFVLVAEVLLKKVIDLIEFIDTLFNPVLDWLVSIKDLLKELSVPASRGINIDYYLGPFARLGGWTVFITTVIGLSFIYVVSYIICAYRGAFIYFKDTIKWW